jgi:hypothetical protein
MPRIRFARNVYDCRLPDFWQTKVWGFGLTPAQAYQDWLRQFVQAGGVL